MHFSFRFSSRAVVGAAKLSIFLKKMCFIFYIFHFYFEQIFLILVASSTTSTCTIHDGLCFRYAWWYSRFSVCGVFLFQIARGGTFVPECVLVHSCSRISGGRILFSVMAFRFRLCGGTIVSVCVAVLSFQSECGGALASGPAR